MNILNKTFYCTDYKKGGRVRRWGRILDISELKVTVYIPSAPLGSKIYQVTKSELADWIKKELIFRKERTLCHTK